MRSQVGVLIAGVLFAWLIVSYPAWRFGGILALQLSGAAALLCLAPAIVTFLWGLKALAGSPVDRLRHALLGMLLRMAVVFGGGMALYFGLPGFERTEFWLWTAGFYLATLALETVLLNHTPALILPPSRPMGRSGSEAKDTSGA